MTETRSKTRKKGYVEIDQAFCKGCGMCVHFCPQSCLAISGNINASGYATAACVDKDPCTGCATCALVCAEAAIEVYRG